MTDAPSDTMTVAIAGEQHSLFMPYALKSELAALVGDSGAAMDNSIEHEIRDQVIVKCLTKRGRAGCLEGPIDLFELECDEMEEIFDWAMEHVLSFFLRRMENGNATIEKTLKRFEILDQGSSETSLPT